jgi:hypothetical protein
MLSSATKGLEVRSLWSEVSESNQRPVVRGQQPNLYAKVYYLPKAMETFWLASGQQNQVLIRLNQQVAILFFI